MVIIPAVLYEINLILFNEIKEATTPIVSIPSLCSFKMQVGLKENKVTSFRFN